MKEPSVAKPKIRGQRPSSQRSEIARKGNRNERKKNLRRRARERKEKRKFGLYLPAWPRPGEGDYIRECDTRMPRASRGERKGKRRRFRSRGDDDDASGQSVSKKKKNFTGWYLVSERRRAHRAWPARPSEVIKAVMMNGERRSKR